jgi:cation:H+ antiporter
LDFIIFTISMAVLIYGATYVIKESESIALHFNIPHFIIGATLVALGTSLPEMAASITAGLKDQADMAVSNVVGSNIFNIALVLGLVFLVAKNISPDRDLFAKDSAWVIFPIFIFILMAMDGVISRFDGMLFLLIMVAYVMFLSQDAKRLMEEIEEATEDREKFNWTKTIIILVIAFVGIIAGANFAIDSATNIARDFGVSEWIIGMFLIAFGTSLPELVVTIVAAKKGNVDMSIGNIIGSNVANLSVVVGATAMSTPLAVDLAKNIFDITALIVISLTLVFITANRLYNKPAGIVLLVMLGLVIQNATVSL